ncbi:MAG: hypothetical protein AB2A00_09785 [Myxococcota bacterium]
MAQVTSTSVSFRRAQQPEGDESSFGLRVLLVLVAFLGVVGGLVVADMSRRLERAQRDVAQLRDVVARAEVPAPLPPEPPPPPKLLVARVEPPPVLHRTTTGRCGNGVIHRSRDVPRMDVASSRP